VTSRPTPPPPEPVRLILAQTTLSGFQTGIWLMIPLELTEAGRLDITVDWTSEETWLYVYFGDTRCDFKQVNTGTCPFLVESETKDPKPRILYSEPLEPGPYFLYLYNVPRDPDRAIGSDVTETLSILIGLTLSAG
jgi:hypothetical protein